ncbi:hypothetical protein ACVWXM_009917 [Bradyrhizobium sp. GM7.3]
MQVQRACDALAQHAAQMVESRPTPNGEGSAGPGTAENVVEAFRTCRGEQAILRFRSHQKVVTKQQRSCLIKEIDPVRLPQRKGELMLLKRDEHPQFVTRAINPIARILGGTDPGVAPPSWVSGPDRQRGGFVRGLVASLPTSSRTQGGFPTQVMSSFENPVFRRTWILQTLIVARSRPVMRSDVRRIHCRNCRH